MKQSLFIFLLSISFLSAHAQLKLGIKGGLNFSNVAVASSVSQGQVPSFNSATSYHVGAFLRIGVGLLGLQPEFLISSKGGVENLPAGGTTSLDLTYATIPVMVVLKPIPILSIQAGPEFGFLMSAKEGGNNIKESFQGSDLGIALGAQADLPLGLHVGVRYVLGINKVSELDISNDMGEVIGNADYKNRVLQAYIGWAFL